MPKPRARDAGGMDLFAVTAPGLEAICARELAAFGVVGTVEPGGVAWEGSQAELYAANLRLRTASRILLRVAEFRAGTFWELERRAARLAWERFVAPGQAVRLRVTCRRSKLYHEGAVAERLLESVERRVGSLTSSAQSNHAHDSDADDSDEPTDEAGQLFVVRFFRDRCTLSADASGALLHRRGYRQELGRAPLRETLAAGIVLASGWGPDHPLLDPFCGSGTIPIEAALLARGIAPGLASPNQQARAYAFHDWPDFDAGLWAEVVARAAAEIRPAAAAPIVASDRDAGAIAAAESNAARAGVTADLTLENRPLSAIDPPLGTGWLVSNPPYGVRVGESEALRDLYAALGRVAKGRLAGWTLAILSADRRLEAQVGVRWTELLRSENGGIPVRLVASKLPRGAAPRRPESGRETAEPSPGEPSPGSRAAHGSPPSLRFGRG